VEIVGSVATADDARMKIQLEGVTSANRIRSYAPGRIAINQDIYTASLIVTPDRVVADWRPRSITELTVADIEVVRALQPEVVLLGTGTRLLFPDPTVIRGLVTAQIGFEAMDTGAACRTFNVLMSEGRRVAAALVIDEQER
jgi:uncharacterized protein